MNERTRHLIRLGDLMRVRDTRLRLASSEASRRRQEAIAAARVLERALRRRSECEMSMAVGSEWAESVGDILRAERACEQARIEAEQASQQYRRASLRQQALVSEWSRRLQFARGRRLDREEDER